MKTAVRVAAAADRVARRRDAARFRLRICVRAAATYVARRHTCLQQQRQQQRQQQQATKSCAQRGRV